MAFTATQEASNGIVKIRLAGELDASVAGQFRDEVEKAAAQQPKRLVLLVEDLDYIASAGLRVLIFAKQKMGSDVDIFIVGAQEGVEETLRVSGFHYSVTLLDEYDAAQIENI